MAYETFDLEWSRPFIGTYQETFLDTTANDESDVGGGSFRETETKLRRSFTYTRRAKSKQEYLDIKQFVRNLKGRARAFHWYHHFEGEMLLVRFRNMPVFAPPSSDNAWDVQITVSEI